MRKRMGGLALGFVALAGALTSQVLAEVPEGGSAMLASGSAAGRMPEPFLIGVLLAGLAVVVTVGRRAKPQPVRSQHRKQR